MNNISNYTKTSSSRQALNRLELTNKPKLIILEKAQKQIDWLHAQVGRKEWSGELITREEGSITSLEDWTIYVEDVFLVDVGTATYTAYEVDKGGFKAADIVQMYEEFPGLLDGTLRNQHIHTHNTMSTFFSSTDWENLEDRACISNYFLMLIVNFSGPYCAKVAWKAKKTVEGSPKLEFCNNQDGLSSISLTGVEQEELLVVMDCVIELENPVHLVDEAFQRRYNRVVNALAEEAKTTIPISHGQSFLDFEGWNNHRGWNSGSWKTEKKIAEMTEKEWTHSQVREQGEMGIRSFSLSEARMVLNMAIHGHDEEDRSDCTKELEKLDKKLKGGERKQWMEETCFSLAENAGAMFFQELEDEDYLGLYEQIRMYLQPYRSTPLIAEILDAVKEMSEVLYAEVIEEKGGVV